MKSIVEQAKKDGYVSVSYTHLDNSRIAANAVVLTEIPPDSTAVGVPAKVVRVAGEKVDFASNVDQIHICLLYTSRAPQPCRQ